jgi:hypothetical protein
MAGCRGKLREWAGRYAGPLLIGKALTLIAANAGRLLSGNVIVAAFLGTWADNLGFYGFVAFRDMKGRKAGDFLKVGRNMLVEFGPAEYLDSFVVRPLFLSVFPYLIADYSLAVLLGSIAADVTYFIPVIISYESRKRMFKD